VIIDTDMAPDDWMAILFLLQRPDVNVLAITVSGTGEAHCDPGVRNALGLAALAGRSGIPVACGRESPLEGDHAFPEDWRTRADTLSGLELPQTELPAGDEGAVELLTRLALESPKRVSILTLGPLTNLAEAVQQEPALVEYIETVVIMGGALAVPGNVGLSGVDIDNQVAEWNFYIDPFAVKIVFGSGLPVLLVPLDATNEVALGSEFFRQLKANRQTPEAEFVYQALAKMQDSITSGGYYFWDPLAAGLLVDESLGTIAEGNVKVFTVEGPNSGLVREMAGGDLIRYAASAQRDRFYFEFLRTLNQP
jgi:pyrimidine-specific ribonucleoside hydrolase